MENKLLIAAAGSGKTTFLINQALGIKPEEKVLITTYTDNNANEIKNKIIKRIGYIPKNIQIKNWFSFLLTDMVRPYQDILDPTLDNINIGFFIPKNQKDKYIKKSDVRKYYFINNKLIPDTISDFIFTTNTNGNNCVFNRLELCYKHIFIDEIQDLAGYDLELIKLLLRSKIHILMVGDPRQTVYQTNHSKKNSKYSYGNIKDYLIDNKIKNCHIDEISLNISHRNIKDIIVLSSELFPEYPSPTPCTCEQCHDKNITHLGIKFIHEKDVEKYYEKYKPVILRWDKRRKISFKSEVFNMGESKGLTFDHVLIYPTKDMTAWLKDRKTELKPETKTKLYVAITRARYSVCFVLNDSENFIKNLGINVLHS